MNYYELILTIVLGHIETLLKRTTFQKIKLGGVRRIYYIYRSANILVFINIRYFGEKKWQQEFHYSKDWRAHCVHMCKYNNVFTSQLFLALWSCCAPSLALQKMFIWFLSCNGLVKGISTENHGFSHDIRGFMQFFIFSWQVGSPAASCVRTVRPSAGKKNGVAGPNSPAPRKAAEGMNYSEHPRRCACQTYLLVSWGRYSRDVLVYSGHKKTLMLKTCLNIP